MGGFPAAYLLSLVRDPLSLSPIPVLFHRAEFNTRTLLVCDPDSRVISHFALSHDFIRNPTVIGCCLYNPTNKVPPDVILQVSMIQILK